MASNSYSLSREREIVKESGEWSQKRHFLCEVSEVWCQNFGAQFWGKKESNFWKNRRPFLLTGITMQKWQKMVNSLKGFVGKWYLIPPSGSKREEPFFWHATNSDLCRSSSWYSEATSIDCSLELILPLPYLSTHHCHEDHGRHARPGDEEGKEEEPRCFSRRGV